MTYPTSHPFAVFNENPAHRYQSRAEPDSPQQRAVKTKATKPDAEHPIRKQAAIEAKLAAARAARVPKERGKCPMCAEPMGHGNRHYRLFEDGFRQFVCTTCSAAMPKRAHDRRSKA
jgi:hypothetical protein